MWRNKAQRGTDRAQLESYLIEFMWLKTIGKEEQFDKILAAIAKNFPPH